MLPLELAGWLLLRLGMLSSEWVAVVSSDPRLVAGLVANGPSRCRVLWAVSGLPSGDSDYYVDEKVQVLDQLWGQAQRMEPVDYTRASASIYCVMLFFQSAFTLPLGAGKRVEVPPLPVLAGIPPWCCI